ncbi:Probable outer membrane efflux protein precursor [Flavobacterium indicum GPTSA100-9 = DSM 17447]|uniref:Probable outer membrane efflux protein n=1 Tax=Flavobacterium indicum (strain DSM 17447 / CIP 109464 / GPTSA100-9) TaxID=1094466 RepID=H8XUU2_FLAIG|nr:TolC family protein [Flavobacterium indicum]CCG53870.1 Probable outer membrane efflux protein precursor [Flavobacterium indicum GPTSA100-9 = DSM 17447]
MKKKNLKIGFLALLIAFSLQSCFVAKQYQKPTISTDKLYRTEAKLDSTSIGQLSWKELFTDSQLQAYINEGLQNNLDLQIAIQNMSVAEATMKQGKAGYWPTVTGNATWTHQETSANSQFGRLFSSIDQYELSTRMSWEADIWGKIRSTKRATQASYLQSQAAKTAVQTDLVSKIASLYYQMLATQEQIKVVEQTLKNRNESVEVITALKKAGSVNEVAVKQTEAQKWATEITLKDLKYNLKVMENAFNVLLNKKFEAVAKGNFSDQNISAEIKTGVPALLLSNRPDVIAAEMNFRNTFELTNVAKSNFYPTLTITPTAGFQSLELQTWFSANSFFANIITGLTQPIFNQRQIRTRYEIAKTNQQIAYLNFEKSLLIAGKEVSDALANYENETEKLVIRQKQVDALKKAAEYSDELLKFGMVTYLEVLTAKDNALNTELNFIDNKYKQLNAVITLYKALGGGAK